MHQVFWVSYYDVREANLTWNVLDGWNILGVKLKLSAWASAYKVSFKIGDIVPADCCLTEAAHCCGSDQGNCQSVIGSTLLLRTISSYVI